MILMSWDPLSITIPNRPMGGNSDKHQSLQTLSSTGMETL